MKYDVFISYRRSGGGFLGMLLKENLEHKGYRVFFDVEDMDSGMFSSQIQHVIEQAPDFIIVLSGDALGKCTDSFDWMRLEIEWALGSGKNIIPVFTRDFTWPETLPKEIAAIKFYHGITIRNDTFEQSAGQIEQLLASGRAAGGKKDYLENKGPELR